MEEKVIIAYKNIGETPLECLERVRLERSLPSNLSMTYAGRLDPMAEGVMIILSGDECKNKDKYLGLDKAYEFEILVGFATDTYDLLGVVLESSNEGLRTVWPSFQKNSARRSEDLSNSSFEDGRENLFSGFAQTLQSFIGTFTQKYPSFSSKTVDGKQLFQISKDDNLPEELPSHEVTISVLSCTSTWIQKKDELEKEIMRRIALVHGDFRQEEILNRWQEVLANSTQESFQIINCTMSCTSGTYVRQLVADIGRKLAIPLVTYSIKRTKIGDY